MLDKIRMHGDEIRAIEEASPSRNINQESIDSMSPIALTKQSAQRLDPKTGI